MRITNKKTLLLHVCCAPDATVVIERLANDYFLLLCFYNPNIHPETEYLNRKAEVDRVAEKMGVDTVDCNYDDKVWFELTNGLEFEPEKGRRCEVCFTMRLREIARIAKREHADIFTTVLTVSPHKDAQLINRIGLEIGCEFGLEYLLADFKKKDGFKRSLELSKLYGLYRQDYCGCIFSKKERETKKRLKKTNEGKL